MKKLYDQNLFDETFVKSLPHLKTLIKKRFASGQIHGLSVSKSHQQGEEFSYYLPYTPGDEIRHIDWNVFARTEEFFVKRSQQSKNMTVKILLDTSSSMTMGKPKKIEHAKKIVAGIAYVALYNGCSIQILILQNNHVYGSEIYKNPKYFLSILTFLSQIKDEERCDIVEMLNKSYSFVKRNEWIIFISDLFHAKKAYSPLRKIATSNYLQLIHLMAQEDVDPTTYGEVVLQDTETKDELVIKITAKEQLQYRQYIKKFLDEWQRFCLRHNISYQYISNQTAPLPIIIQALQNGHF